ncbi:MAG: uracil-DNA glycosylase family protein [Coraliomargaritaceae bacterium]
MKLERQILYESLKRLKETGENRVYLSDKTQEYIFELLKNKLQKNQRPSLKNEKVTYPSGPIHKNPSSFNDLLKQLKDNESKEDRLNSLHELCSNYYQNIELLFGGGSFNPKIVFLIESPNLKESQEKALFTNKVGELFNKIISAMGITNKDIYLCPLFKSHVLLTQYTNGDASKVDEALTLFKQELDILSPNIIVGLGNSIGSYINGNETKPYDQISGRGVFFKFNGFESIITFSLSSLILKDNLETKRLLWEDLLQVMDKLNLNISEKQRNYFK